MLVVQPSVDTDNAYNPHMNMTPNKALERAVKGLAVGAAGARNIIAPAAPGRVVPRPAQRGR